MKTSELDKAYNANIFSAQDLLEEVLVLQEIFRFAINLCLDKENYRSGMYQKS